MDLLVVICLTAVGAGVVLLLLQQDAAPKAKAKMTARAPLPPAHGPGGTTTQHPEELGWPT